EVGSAKAAAERRIYGEIRVDDDLATIKEKLIQLEIRGLQETVPLLDEERLRQAVEAILGARQIHFYGVGASGMVALDAQHKFARIGLPAWAYVDPHQATAFASLLQEGMWPSASPTRATPWSCWRPSRPQAGRGPPPWPSPPRWARPWPGEPTSPW